MFILKLKHIKHSYNICNMPFVKKEEKKKKCFLFLAVYFCPIQLVMTIKTAKLKRHWNRSLLECWCTKKKKEKVHMKCTHLQSKTGLHCKTSEKAHGDRPPELFSWQQQTLHRDMHPFTFLSIILHKYKAFTLKAYTDRRFTDQYPNHGKNVHNALHQVAFGRHSAYSLCYEWQIVYHSKNQWVPVLCFGILSIAVHETNPPPAKKY